MAKKRWQDLGGGSAPERKSAPSNSNRSWRDRGQGKKAAGVSNSALKGIIGLFGLIMVLAMIVVVVYWLNPLPQPRVAIITARNRSWLMPPNSYALADAEALAKQTDFIRPASSGVPTSLSYAEMQGLVSHLPKLQGGRFWFSWEKTSAIVYVNAQGVALWEPSESRAVPYILPDDYQVPTQQQLVKDVRAVSVRELLTNFAKCQADQKLLVLDCQQLDHLWPLGVLTNEFVESVEKELERLKPEEKQNLYVIYSCSPGEVTWSDPEAGHTAFGYYFLKGITGAADRETGNKDGRVRLSELHQFISGRVADWARRNRADTQTPVLQTFGQSAESVSLVALGDFPAYKEAGPLSADAAALTALRAGWREYYQLGRDETAVYHYAPQLWRYLEDTLLRAERFWRAGDLDAAKEEIRNVSFRIEDIREARRDYAVGGMGYSLPMEAMLRGMDAMLPNQPAPPPLTDKPADKPTEKKDEKKPADEKKIEAKEKGADAKKDAKEEPKDAKKKEDAPREPAPGSAKDFARIFAGIVQDVADRGASITDAAEKMRGGLLQQAPAVPIEAHLIRMLDEHMIAPLGATPPPDALRQARELVSLRVLSERSAVPGGTLAPDIFRWVWLRVDKADRHRRLREDRTFAERHTQVPVGPSPEKSSGSEAESLYLKALADAEKIAAAYKVREQLLAELPHIVRLVAMRNWQQADESLLVQVRNLAAQLTQEIRQMEGRLFVDPATQWNELGPIDREIIEIEQLRRSLIDRRAQLMDKLSNESRRLGETKGPARTQNDWRRVNDILTVPFASHPDDPDESARVRLNLLSRVLGPVLQEGQAATVEGGAKDIGNFTVDREERQRTALRLAKLAEEFFTLGREPLKVEDGLPAEVGYMIGRSWRLLYNRAVSPPVKQGDYNQMFQSESAARRILDGFLSKKGEYSYVDQLRRLNLSEFFAWHSRRFGDDFWAGAEGNKETYFMRSSGYYLERALTYHSRPTSGYSELREHLNHLAEVASQLRVDVTPGKVRFRGTDVQELRAGVFAPPGYPDGIAALRSQTDARSIEIRQLPIEGGQFPYKYRLDRMARQGESTTLDLNCLFRGHVASQEVPILLSNDEEGPTVVYRDQLGPDADLIVRLAESEKSDMKVLFLIDCSLSMAAGSPTRMDLERSVLKTFIDATPNNSIEVGVRLFGHRYKFNAAGDEMEAKARTDTELVLPVNWFDRKKFEDYVLNVIRPTGDTPLFNALIEARNDFANISGGNKQIIVLSDGADSWTGIAGYPGIKELKAKYDGSGIKINTIGFQVEDAAMTQLQGIAAATGGVSSRADQADDLLKQVTGLLGMMKYAAFLGAKGYPTPPRTLQVLPDPVRIPPGLFEVRVFGADQNVAGSLKDIRVYPGQRHEFVYSAGRLAYATEGFADSLAQTSDKGSGIAFSVLKAKPQSEGLEVVFSLYNTKLPDWRPEGITVLVRPKGGTELWTFENLPPNVGGFHVPVWSFVIEEWPNRADSAEIEVRWTDPGAPNPDGAPYTIAWGEKSLAGKLPPGFELTLRDWKPRNIAGRLRNTAKVKLVFPQSVANIQQYSVGFDQAVAYSRQIYNLREGVYTGEFVLANEGKPDTMHVYPPRQPRQGSILKTIVRIGGKTLN